MRICGLEGVSLIDFPGRIASVLFLGGCNFRCPFCQNPDLVLRPESLAHHEPDDVVRAIARRKGLVDGVVVTGGEPLINGESLMQLLCALRNAGLAVKLDTNGYEVEVLREVLAERLVDFVAMDVKTSPSRYAEAAGRVLDSARILEAISVISGSGISHEFRTTCVPGLVERQDVEAIAARLGQRETLVLQQFRAGADLIDPSYSCLTPHSADAIRCFAEAVRPMVGGVAVRGL